MLRSEVRFLLAPRKSPGQSWFRSRRFVCRAQHRRVLTGHQPRTAFPQVGSSFEEPDSLPACPLDKICCPGGARLGHGELIDHARVVVIVNVGWEAGGW